MALIQKTLHNSAALKVRRRQKGEKCGVPAGDALVHVRAVGAVPGVSGESARVWNAPCVGAWAAFSAGVSPHAVASAGCVRIRQGLCGKGHSSKGIPARAFQQGGFALFNEN